MLSLELVRLHPDVVRSGLRRRGEKLSLDQILLLSDKRSGLATRCDALYVRLKKLKDQVRKQTENKRIETNKQIKLTSTDIRQLEIQISDLDAQLNVLLQSLPNIPQQSVPDGDVDQELGRWGETFVPGFQPQAHWDLGKRLGMLDFEGGAKIAGSRFVLQTGWGARLERALISFMLDLHTREHDYLEILPPLLAKRSVMQGAGQFPKFENQAYVCNEDELYLNPTAEVPLVGMLSDTTFEEAQLPLRYVSWTTAFRREAGSSSNETRGLLRLHQFNKVELFQVVHPAGSTQAFEQMLSHAEAVLRLLDLPYRVMLLSTENLPFSSVKTLDLEVWMPAQHRYVEISSLSNCEAFQARRAQIRYRSSQGVHSDFVYTLNASGLAVGRTLAAILEMYQQADGSVVVPKALRPYMGTGLLSM